ncbi:tail fiber domain-containing protein [Candidatus Dependentiae bacterium]|nr:tail fiber domain-containing protein [Candidatus Dependentiae bacterium]
MKRPQNNILFLSLVLLLSTKTHSFATPALTNSQNIVFVTPEACQSARQLKELLKVEECPESLRSFFSLIEQDVPLLPLEIAQPALQEILNLLNDESFPALSYPDAKKNLEAYAKELNEGNAAVTFHEELGENLDENLDQDTTRRPSRLRIFCNLLVKKNLVVKGRMQLGCLNGVLQAKDGLLFAGPINGSAEGTPLNIPNTLVARDGTGSFAATDIIVDGDINLTVDPSTGPGAILKKGQLFIHNPGQNNTAIGLNSLENNTTGESNSALGSRSLRHNTSGKNNTGAGAFSLQNNTKGQSNAALGTFSLLKNTDGLNNTAVGAFSLQENQSGYNNTAVGTFSLLRNQGTLRTEGRHNTGVGAYTLVRNNTGSDNTALGFNALGFDTSGGTRINGVIDFDTASSTTQDQPSSQPQLNTAIGVNALSAVTTASDNVALGIQAGLALTSGSENILIGNNAGARLTDNTQNTLIGTKSGLSLTTGTRNTFVGNNTGQNNTTGDSNIYINNLGVDGDNNTTRIGTEGTQTATFIAGIRDAILDINNDPQPVQIDSNGQLGTVIPAPSSKRFKENIADMGNTTDNVLNLRPVTFTYKPEVNKSGLTQFGLIAEEVAQFYPHLVTYSKDGQIQGVKYEQLNVLLLNELKKLYTKQQQQTKQIEQLQKSLQPLSSTN